MVWVKPLLLPQQLLSTDYLLTLHVGTIRRHNTSITTNSKENTKKKSDETTKQKKNKNDPVWIILEVLSFFVWNQGVLLHGFWIKEFLKTRSDVLLPKPNKARTRIA